MLLQWLLVQLVNVPVCLHVPGNRLQFFKALRDGMDLVFASKLTCGLPLPDGPNLEGLLHIFVGLNSTFRGFQV